jgi:hypothetical protein
VPGVASISVDLHKYGYGPKTVSGVFYQAAGASLEVSSSSSMTGLRGCTDRRSSVARAAVAQSPPRGRWRAISDATDIAAAPPRFSRHGMRSSALWRAPPSSHQIGRSELGTVAIGGSELYVQAIAAGLKARGWPMNLLKDPHGIQFVLGPCVTHTSTNSSRTSAGQPSKQDNKRLVRRRQGRDLFRRGSRPTRLAHVSPTLGRLG